MKIKVTEVIEVDIKKERRRINTAFEDRPEMRMKLHEMVDAFEALDFEKYAELYNNLGYDEEGEHPEAEFVNYRYTDFVNECLTWGKEVEKIEE